MAGFPGGEPIEQKKAGLIARPFLFAISTALGEAADVALRASLCELER
jgi:hypothetical protein